MSFQINDFVQFFTFSLRAITTTFLNAFKTIDASFLMAIYIKPLRLSRHSDGEGAWDREMEKGKKNRKNGGMGLGGLAALNLRVYVYKKLFVPVSLFHAWTAVPISAKFCTDLPTNSRKCVLNTTMTPPAQLPDSGIPQTPKPKQIIGEKTLPYKKCPDVWLNLI